MRMNEGIRGEFSGIRGREFPGEIRGGENSLRGRENIGKRGEFRKKEFQEEFL